MFLVPIETGNHRAKGGITGYDAVEIGRVALSLYQSLATAI